ncbi:MAG: hypothetical protein K8R90_05260 [Candidatus Cloacimonetes bacterium]|nr:hypothetical protein [Candidatus Cloacimonadota bacterium]
MTEQFNPQVIYSVSMIVERTGWSRMTILREIAEGRLLGRRTSDRGHWRVTGSDLNAWWTVMPNSSDPYALEEGA